MSQNILMWKWMPGNSAAALLIVAVAAAGANAAGDTPNHPLIGAATGELAASADPDGVLAAWDDVRPPPQAYRTSAMSMETEALAAAGDGVRVWTDDFRPPPKGF